MILLSDNNIRGQIFYHMMELSEGNMDNKKKELIIITVITIIIVGACIGINALEKGSDYDSSL